jgi:hypothetical protein
MAEAIWEDVTSYSRGDTERVPTTWTLVIARKCSPLRVTVTCGHLYYRPKWAMLVYPFITEARACEAETLEEAKAEAVRVAVDALNKLHADLNAALFPDRSAVSEASR